MSTINALKNEVAEIKSRVNPEPKHFAIHCSFGTSDEPHSYLSGRILHILTPCPEETQPWFEAGNAEAELVDLKKYYEKTFVNKTYNFMKGSDHPYSTFEKFVTSQTCICGKHGLDGKQPYLGECH